MSWNEAQKHRLATEKSMLERYFPGRVKWINPTNHNLKVEMTTTTLSGNKYTLRIYVNGNFPNAAPDMVVVSSPKPMPDWGNSYENCTLSKRDGYVRIRYVYESHWTDSSTLFEVFIKGQAWLGAYEGHIKSRKLLINLYHLAGF